MSATNNVSRSQPETRAARWPWYLLVWTLIVLFYSTTAIAEEGPHDWIGALKSAMAQWYVWALLTPLIVRLDRLLPVAPDELIKRLLYHVPFSLLFTAVFTYLHLLAAMLLRWKFDAGMFTPNLLLRSFSGMFQWNVLVYCAIVGVYATFEYHKHWKDRQLRTAELERLLSESRLEMLRAQLHPHFLFNSLNAISAYIDRDARTARRMLEKLGELLRMSLEHAADQEIPLEREIAFVERYLDLQQMRFEDRLEVLMKIEPDVLDALVPTFILQPLVENSIRHGISARPTPGVIEVRAWRDNGRLHLRVRDDGPGLPSAWDPDRTSGVGIANTRERLRTLYGESGQQLEIEGAPGNGVRVDISLPFTSNGVGAPGAAVR